MDSTGVSTPSEVNSPVPDTAFATAVTSAANSPPATNSNQPDKKPSTRVSTWYLMSGLGNAWRATEGAGRSAGPGKRSCECGGRGLGCLRFDYQLTNQTLSSLDPGRLGRVDQESSVVFNFLVRLGKSTTLGRGWTGVGSAGGLTDLGFGVVVQVNETVELLEEAQEETLPGTNKRSAPDGTDQPDKKVKAGKHYTGS